MQPAASWISAILLSLAALATSACGGSPDPLGGSAGDSGGSNPGIDSGAGTGDAGTGSEGGTQSCSTPVACGTGGTTYEECTVLGSTGQCAAIVYKTSDGQAFTCAGCTSCAAAQQQLASYCQAELGSDGGNVGDGSTRDSGAHDGGNGGTSCTAPIACGTLGATYEQCTTTSGDGTCTAAEYEVAGGGPIYACASCGNCAAAVANLDAYCAAQTPTTTCTLWSACESSPLSYEECTTSAGTACQAKYYQTTDGQKFDCASCGDCTSALSSMDTYCNQKTTPVTTCGATSACGIGGATYDSCTTSQGAQCDSVHFATSDGKTFTCASCSDCTAALLSVESYCSTLTTTGGVLLFGGFATGGTSLADTWVWNGSTWTAGAAGPAARADARGATLNGKFVVYGGTTSTSVTSNQSDTWGWSGSSWTQLATTGPSARFGSAVAALGSDIVLFGGCNTDTAANDLADTWLWNGSAWSSLTVTGPTARVGAAAATLDGQVVFFGGMDASSTYPNDTWVFDGTTWTQMTPAASPPGRFYAAVATLDNQVVLFGGSDGADLADTWVWDGSTWTQLMITGPTARGNAAAAAWNGGIVLFGGSDSLGTYDADTWVFNGSTWTAQTATGPQAREGATMGAFP